MPAIAFTMFVALPMAANAACPAAQPINFAPGASSAEVVGEVPRGDRDCYSLRARGGQRLVVTQIDAPDDNIVIQLYVPPVRASIVLWCDG